VNNKEIKGEKEKEILLLINQKEEKEWKSEIGISTDSVIK